VSIKDTCLDPCSNISRQVTLEEATTKATGMNIMFMETSAKAGHNVKSLFKKIAMSLPGMEDGQSTDAQNQSESRPAVRPYSSSSTCFLEIDVKTTKTDVPEASACQC
jgi:Ras-related protein Rab-6A